MVLETAAGDMERRLQYRSSVVANIAPGTPKLGREHGINDGRCYRNETDAQFAETPEVDRDDGGLANQRDRDSNDRCGYNEHTRG